MPNIIDRIVKDAQAPASSRTAFYAARLDAHLETLPDDAARLAFCEQQARKWVNDYEQFALAVDSGRYKGTASAWDYQLSIAAINERIGKYRPLVTPANPAFWQGAQA